MSGAQDFALYYVQDPTAFYVIGRATVAVMGALTCLVVYGVARKIYDPRTALIAAFIGATAYYHSVWSHYINVDIGMTLALWASVLAYLHYEDRNDTRWLVAAGILGGIGVAFKLPGAIVLPMLALAIVTRREQGWAFPLIVKRLVTMTVATIATVAVVSPENILLLGRIAGSFSGLLGETANAQELGAQVGIDAESVDAITIFRDGSYIEILLFDMNVVLTLLGIAGALIGGLRRERWTLLLSSIIVLYVGVMSLADRGGNERYLLPVIPAFWLLGAHAITTVAKGRTGITAIAVSVVVAVPLYYLIRDNHTFTRPDTRVLAKSWIESNVPSGAKILMDGMRFRFIQSPPLNPDESTVARRLSRASDEGDSLSRGISSQTLDLYAQGMSLIGGPKYELHSTVWGLAVEDLSYYGPACFDYIVTSSQVRELYSQPAESARFPKSAHFYAALPNDPRFERVFSVEPESWRIQGPAIDVYRVLDSCSHSHTEEADARN